MNSQKLQQLLSELKSELIVLYGESFVDLLLFGSRARGDCEEDSDIDVALILDDFDDYWQEIQRTSTLVSHLSLEYETVVTLLKIRRSDWVEKELSVVRNIQSEGVRL